MKMPVQVFSARNVTALCRINPSELGQFLTFSIRGKLNRFERERPLYLRLRGLIIACSALRYTEQGTPSALWRMSYDTRKDKQYLESLEGISFHDRTLAFG